MSGWTTHPLVPIPPEEGAPDGPALDIMRTPVSASSLLALPVLLTLLGAPRASAASLLGESEEDASPVRCLLVADESDAMPQLEVQPEPSQEVPRGWRPPPPEVKHQVARDAPITAGMWATYGAFALVPLGGIYGASRLGDGKPLTSVALTLGGGLVGAFPGNLLFLHPAEAGGRWSELDVAAFGAGLVLTPPLAALGTWGMGELALGGSQDRGRAFLGALGGAAVGTLLGVAMHGVLEEVVGNRPALRSFRKYIALGFIGSGATLGYQWAGGGPRPRAH